ncbi:hypothetical protein Fmac_027556 [Flemingia macrophylla]|uniref:Uncharacterized protein n=1 Tax=Flemingia macrophylla TaxID=520843 RepID=A0ABD1LI72_9FABA
MGNFVWMVTALISANDELPELVTKFREAVLNSINSDFVRNFQGEGGFVNYCEASKHAIETAMKIAMMSRNGKNEKNLLRYSREGRLQDVLHVARVRRSILDVSKLPTLAEPNQPFERSFSYVRIIKPSYPTTHAKSYKLSILDQFVPPEYIPMVLFYSGNQNTQAITDITHQRMKQLKESLSQVLTLFYPFAGRVKDRVTINCNDEGVHFTEAKVSCSLSEFFNLPNLPSLLYKLIPNQALDEVSTEGYTTMVKVTCFACGSMVIGTLVSHMVTDGAALTSANDELAELVNKFREAVNSINSDFVKNFQGEGGFVKYCETSKHLIETASDSARMSTNGVNYLNYSIWCNFGLYDVDFGWGKPIWVSCIPECDDYAILMDTPWGKGIEVWVPINEDKMSILQQDSELFMFATLDPNPLQLKDYLSHS